MDEKQERIDKYMKYWEEWILKHKAEKKAVLEYANNGEPVQPEDCDVDEVPFEVEQ